MADITGLSAATNDCKGTLEKATATIRSLIKERNAALAACDPALVKVMQDETETELSANTLRLDVEAARKDTESAISEAAAIPTLPAKASTAQYPKKLGDSTNLGRPIQEVHNVQEENSARFNGFNVQIPTATTPAS